MHDAGGMKEPHRTQQIVHDDFDMFFRQKTNSFYEQTPQVLPNALEDDHDPAKLLVTVVFRDNEVKDFGRVNVFLRVSELTQDFHLLEDGLQASCVSLNVRSIMRPEFDYFDGDLLAGGFAVALEDLAEGARANLLADSVISLLEVVLWR